MLFVFIKSLVFLSSYYKVLNLQTMEIANKITNTLNASGKVEFTGFGVLSMLTKHAQVDAKNDRILPPKQELVFKLDRSVKADNEFLSLSYQLLKSLLENGEAQIDGIGKWTSVAGKVDFVAEDNVLGNSFYGLEEIVFPRVDAKSAKNKANEINGNDYKMNKSILWTFLVAVPVAAMLYLAFTQKHLLIGKPSNLKTQKVENPIKKVVPPVVDSLKIKQQDSVKQDSIKNLVVPKTK